VKLTLRILNISVGIVIVAKLNAQTKIRVAPKMIEAISVNIRSTMPCPRSGRRGAVVPSEEVAVTATVKLLKLEMLTASIFLLAAGLILVSIASFIIEACSKAPMFEWSASSAQVEGGSRTRSGRQVSAKRCVTCTNLLAGSTR
jgi:hypothetical protein